MNKYINEYFQQLNTEWDTRIDELVNKTRKELQDNLGNIEEEIALIEQGYSAEEVLEMTKKRSK